MTKKDKNKYGLHPSELRINKTTDGKDTLGNKYYQKGTCIFPYKKKGEDKKYYECFDDEGIGRKVCPTSLDKKTKEILTVGVCEDIDKLNCEISPEHLPKKAKKEKEGKKHSKKKTPSVESSSGSASNNKFCSGMNNWCTGGTPTMKNPPKSPPDMDDKYEFLRRQTGYAAFYTNPDGNCLFHSIAGSIILDPQLGSDFLDARLKAFEANYLPEGVVLTGENYGEKLRNAYASLLEYYFPYESKFYMVYNLIIGDEGDLKKILTKTLKKIKNENIKDYRDRQIAAGEVPKNLVELENKESYLEQIAIHTSEDKSYDLEEAERTIINYMIEKFIEKIKNPKVYAYDIMGRDLCNALYINLIRHNLYPGDEHSKWNYSFEQEEEIIIMDPDVQIVDINIHYDGKNHYEFMVKLDSLPDGYEGKTPEGKKKKKSKKDKKGSGSPKESKKKEKKKRKGSKKKKRKGSMSS